MMALSDIFKGLASVYSLAVPVVNAVSALMEAAEAASTTPGATKKEAVLAGVKAFLLALGFNFDSLLSMISALIDGAKSAYNSMTAAKAVPA